jgi:hypothetical protein
MNKYLASALAFAIMMMAASGAVEAGYVDDNTLLYSDYEVHEGHVLVAPLFTGNNTGQWAEVDNGWLDNLDSNFQPAPQDLYNFKLDKFPNGPGTFGGPGDIQDARGGLKIDNQNHEAGNIFSHPSIATVGGRSALSLPNVPGSRYDRRARLWIADSARFEDSWWPSTAPADLTKGAVSFYWQPTNLGMDNFLSSMNQYVSKKHIGFWYESDLNGEQLLRATFVNQTSGSEEVDVFTSAALNGPSLLNGGFVADAWYHITLQWDNSGGAGGGKAAIVIGKEGETQDLLAGVFTGQSFNTLTANEWIQNIGLAHWQGLTAGWAPDLQESNMSGARSSMYFDDWRVMKDVLYDVDGKIVGDAVSMIPEPATLTLLGLAGLALVRRRR